MTLKWTRTPNFHPNSPLSRSNSAVHVAISTWPKSNRALAGRATGSGGSATRAPSLPPSRKFVKFVEQATLSPPPPSITKLAGTGGRKAFTPWKWNAAEIADVFSVRRVAKPEVGPAGQKSWFTRMRNFSDYRHARHAYHANWNSCFAYRYLSYPSVLSESIERIDDGGWFEFRGRIF